MFNVVLYLGCGLAILTMIGTMGVSSLVRILVDV